MVSFLVAEVGFEPHDLEAMRYYIILAPVIEVIGRTGVPIATMTLFSQKLSKRCVKKCKIILTFFTLCVKIISKEVNNIFITDYLTITEISRLRKR